MFKQFLSTLLIVSSMSGCAYSVHTTKLEVPVPKAEFVSTLDNEFHSEMSIDNGEQTASIGEDLFVINRYFENTESYEIITHSAPTSFKFPQNAKWSATHKYNDGSSGDLLVYTSPSYYQGQIGVVLDDDLVVSTEEPLVQVSGAKKGRRWKLQGKSRFFKSREKVTKDVTEKVWGLRFGGMSADLYVFEIVNRSDSTVIDILQTVKVSKKDFLNGFVLRDVFIRGTKGYKSGVIHFKAKDLKA